MPTTPAGKARSRLNSTRHGLRATDEVFVKSLKPKDRKVFRHIRDSFHNQYKPRTDSERQLVDRIAIQIFRQLRVYQLENIASADNSVLQHLDRLSRYDSRIEKQLKMLQNRLEYLYFLRGASLPK